MRPPKINDLKNPIHALSLGLGSGLLRPAPGTWGSLAAIMPWLLFESLSLLPYLLILLISFILGVYFCEKTSHLLGSHDHSAIVWDEFVGMWIALTWVPREFMEVDYLGVVIAFIFFRFFDILKPWPIRVVDAKVQGGFGIMIDDVIAGVFACACTHGLITILPQLL